MLAMKHTAIKAFLSGSFLVGIFFTGAELMALDEPWQQAKLHILPISFKGNFSPLHVEANGLSIVKPLNVKHLWVNGSDASSLKGLRQNDPDEKRTA